MKKIINNIIVFLFAPMVANWEHKSEAQSELPEPMPRHRLMDKRIDLGAALKKSGFLKPETSINK